MKAKESKFAAVRLEKSKLMAAIAVLAVMFAAFAVVMPAIEESDADPISKTSSESIGNYTVNYYGMPSKGQESNDAGALKVTTNETDKKFIFEGFVTAGKNASNSSDTSETSKNWAMITVSGITADKVSGTNPALKEQGGAAEFEESNVTNGVYSFFVPRGSDSVVTIKDGETTLTFDFKTVSTKIVVSETKFSAPTVGDFNGKYTYSNSTLALNNYDGKDIFYSDSNLTVTLTGENTISAYGNPDFAGGEGSAIIGAHGNLTIKADANADASLTTTQNTVGAFNISADNGTSSTLTIGDSSDGAKKVTLTATGGNRALYAIGDITISNSDLTLSASEKTIRSRANVSITGSTVSAVLDGSGQQNGDDPDKGLYGIASIGKVSVGEGSKVDAQSIYAKGTSSELEVAGEITVGNAIVNKVTMKSGEATFNGTLTGNKSGEAYGETTIEGTSGTVVLGAKVDLDKIKKADGCTAGITVDPSAMEEMVVGGTTTGKDGATTYPINQIVTVTGGSWTLAPGADITILGQFILPEDATLTIQNGASLTLANGSVSKLDGKVVIEEGDSNATEEAKKTAGILTAAGKVSVTGTVQSYGNIVVGGEFSIEADAVVSVEDTGSILTAAGSKLTVKESGTLELRGAFGIETGATAFEVYNYGLVTIDSEIAASAASFVYQMASGAVVDVVNYAVSAAQTEASKFTLTVTDAQLAPAKGKADVIGNEKGNSIEISATATAKVNGEGVSEDNAGTQKANSLATVSGVRIVENVVSKTTQPKDSESVKIDNKYYVATMDVSGSIAVSFQYTGSDSVSVDGTAAIAFTGKTGVVVSDGAVLTVGAKVTVTNAGVMNVAGKVESVVKGDSSADNAKFSNGTEVAPGVALTVSGNGSVKSNEALKGTVNATNYQTTEGTSKIENYVTLDAALAMVNADGNAVKQLNALGANKVTASAKLPADVTLKQDNTDKNVITIGEKAGDDVTLTIAKGAVLKNNGKITVNGTLYAEDKTNVKGTNIISDVYSEQVNEEGKAVRNGWAQWTNLVNALNGAEAGQTITISKDKNAGDVEISADAEIKAGVTLVVPDDTATLLLKNGVTLTVSGKLVTEQAIKAENSFDVEARNVAVKDGETNYNSSAVVVKGVFASSSVEIKYGYVKPVPVEGADGEFAAQANTSGAPIAGAYYATKDYNYVVSPLSVAIASIADITSEITVKGAVAEGDIAFAATEEVKKIVVEIKTLANPAETVTSLTVASLTLSEGAAVSGGIFNGSVVAGANTVVLKGATGLSAAEKDGKLVLDGTLTVNVKDGSFQVSAGTAVANGLTIETGENGKAVVASGATLEAGKAGIANIDALTVEGTLSVPATYSATIGTLVVYGAVSVTAATSEKTAGTLAVTDLFVGMTSDDYTAKTAAAASVSGKVTVKNIAYVLNGSALDADAQKSVDDLENSTVFHVNGSVWFSAYSSKAGASVKADKAPITDAILAGWSVTENGEPLKDAKGNATFEVSIGGDNENVYAVIKTDIYDIVIKADEGIADVYLNGQAMYYGYVMDAKGAYFAYTATVSAGDYKVTYTLKNGWSGDAKLSGDNVTGMSLKATGDAGQKVYQLTGIEKSGYVEPSEPSDDKDDGMTITDYLLIVLVVLIVILAVIVAMRLMRS